MTIENPTEAQQFEDALDLLAEHALVVSRFASRLRTEAEPKWCAQLDSSAAEETYGPWDSRKEAIAGVTLIRHEQEYPDAQATIGRAETACPVAHGAVSFESIIELIEENATEETFHWVEHGVFEKLESLDDAEAEFQALLRRHLKSRKWAMADAGQEIVTLETGP